MWKTIATRTTAIKSSAGLFAWQSCGAVIGESIWRHEKWFTRAVNLFALWTTLCCFALFDMNPKACIEHWIWTAVGNIKKVWMLIISINPNFRAKQHYNPSQLTVTIAMVIMHMDPVQIKKKAGRPQIPLLDDGWQLYSDFPGCPISDWHSFAKLTDLPSFFAVCPVLLFRVN